MPVTIVVGGQYGSEGKGKAVAHLCNRDDVAAVVRTGGPNAGHTVGWEGGKHVSRSLPSGYTDPDTKLIIGSGGIIDVPLLMSEIGTLEGYGFSVDNRVLIDTEAVVLNDDAASTELDLGFGQRFGSTQTGTGMGSINKIHRDPAICRLARHDSRLEAYTVKVSAVLRNLLDIGKTIIIEGTQGFGLSMHHSGNWPFCTSRDTSAAGFLSETGLSPFDVSRILMVVRTYPIRVGGNSGPMNNEITWEMVHQRAGTPQDQAGPEITSVTKRKRRVGEFDFGLLRRAISVNRPTGLVVHGMDYVNWVDRGVKHIDDLSVKSQEWITKLMMEANIPVDFIYTGPGQEDIIDVCRK